GAPLDRRCARSTSHQHAERAVLPGTRRRRRRVFAGLARRSAPRPWHASAGTTSLVVASAHRLGTPSRRIPRLRPPPPLHRRTPEKQRRAVPLTDSSRRGNGRHSCRPPRFPAFDSVGRRSVVPARRVEGDVLVRLAVDRGGFFELGRLHLRYVTCPFQ